MSPTAARPLRRLPTLLGLSAATVGAVLLRGLLSHDPVRERAPVATSTTAPPDGPRTVTGDPSLSLYGPVQVAVVLDGSRIVDVRAVEAPAAEARSREINADAVPRLRSQVLEAQTADIDGVSGATYTSESYVESLQSALDRR